MIQVVEFLASNYETLGLNPSNSTQILSLIKESNLLETFIL
jgi:hypothetical protein